MSFLLKIFAWNGLYVLLASVSAALGIATLFALKVQKQIHNKKTYE